MSQSVLGQALLAILAFGVSSVIGLFLLGPLGVVIFGVLGLVILASTFGDVTQTDDS